MTSSEITCEINGPVLLNCWKHHAGFIKSKIVQYKKDPERSIPTLTKEILLIGQSLMDLYLGDLTPQEIADAVVSQLKNEQAADQPEYINWLGRGGEEFRIIKLSDRSQWTLRLGEVKMKYVHIHPSRYSPRTIRVRSTTLKSAVLFSILLKNDSEDKLGLINRIRKEYLELPPLKNMSSASAILKLTDLLN